MTDEQLIAKYIEPHPRKPGILNARIVDRGISVTALIAYLISSAGQHSQTAQDYEVPEEAVQAALAYRRRHKDLFDTWIAENAA
jgi:uncharacterized protein (DUF433 family)